MTPDSLFQWWNAIYTIPLAFVLVVLTVTSLLSLVGGALGELGHGEAHGGVGADHDADVDVDADLDVEADVHLDADVEAETGVHGGHASAHAARAEPGALMSGLMFLGVGRAPMMMVLQVLLLLWGVIGTLLHLALGVTGPASLLWSAPVTLCLSMVGTRSFAQLFARLFKPHETASLKRGQIVGRTGRVVFPVTEGEGTVHVRDQHGTLHRLRARAAHGSLETGDEIIVLGYDPDQKVYRVDDASAFVDRP